MTSATSSALSGIKAVESLARADRGRILSALIARLRDFDLAEDALQDATFSAVTHWGRNGVPANPQGWLMHVAMRKAIDRMRTLKAREKVATQLALVTADVAEPSDHHTIPDERLRLIFTCCHPAIEIKSSVALTLRTVVGLSTGEIARAFLDQETTMGQRLSRTKAKIASAKIPYEVPEPEHWPQRLSAVLAVMYLIYNAGYSQPQGTTVDLAEEAIWLTRTLDMLCPQDPEIEGLLALLLLSHARSPARVDSNGMTVPLHQQDREKWNSMLIAEGLAITERALARRKPGAYQIKAAIAACHVESPTSDWPQIVALYSELLKYEPTDVVRLNRAVAIAEMGALSHAVDEVERLATSLAGYQPYHAARADLLKRIGQVTAARQAYEQAIALSQSPADRSFLASRRDALP